MHRLLAKTSELLCDNPALSSEALRHLKVLRPKNGEVFELFDGAGKFRRYRYEGSGLTAIAGEGVVFVERPAMELTLFACITKGSRWEWTIEKATELGVARIVPVISERTIVRIAEAERAAKRERYLRIVEEAARQSDALWIPELSEIVDFTESLALVGKTTCFAGALTEPPSMPIAAAIAAAQAAEKDIGRRGMAVYVGPEGDFTPAELSALLELAVPVSLGPRVLRAETAAIFALSVLAAAGHLAASREEVK